VTELNNSLGWNTNYIFACGIWLPCKTRRWRRRPLVEALDVNHDWIIDSNEIAKLLTLDKNGDGVLTTNEYLPTPPQQRWFSQQAF